jgi:hypothetical protein
LICFLPLRAFTRDAFISLCYASQAFTTVLRKPLSTVVNAFSFGATQVAAATFRNNCGPLGPALLGLGKRAGFHWSGYGRVAQPVRVRPEAEGANGSVAMQPHFILTYNPLLTNTILYE